MSCDQKIGEREILNYFAPGLFEFHMDNTTFILSVFFTEMGKSLRFVKSVNAKYVNFNVKEVSVKFKKKYKDIFSDIKSIASGHLLQLSGKGHNWKHDAKGRASFRLWQRYTSRNTSVLTEVCSSKETLPLKIENLFFFFFKFGAVHCNLRIFYHRG